MGWFPLLGTACTAKSAILPQRTGATAPSSVAEAESRHFHIALVPALGKMGTRAFAQSALDRTGTRHCVIA
jgi:hypothetical protein